MRETVQLLPGYEGGRPLRPPAQGVAVRPHAQAQMP
jgi:hypothetical protein